MTKFEEEFNYLIELSGKVLIGQVDAESFEKNRIAFFEKYETDQQQALPVVPECVGEWIDKNISVAHNAELMIHNILICAIDNKNRYLFPLEVEKFVLKNPITFLNAVITGKYEVEKPQLFRLKLKNATISNYYLWLNHATGKVFVDKKYLDWTNHNNVKNTFKEQEIAKISDGAFVNNEAFELVPVEDGE